MAESRALRSFTAVALVIVLVFANFWQTTASMVEIWKRSETFTHGFLVVPAVLWFVWASRRRLAATEAEPWWPGLVLVIGAGFSWLLGTLADALAPSQWAMVTLVPLIVLTLYGRAWLRILAFPLAFLFFAVPFGEVFVPTLIDWTADFTVMALVATGIPVFREGVQFVIPSGHWSVVEACSGIRYLVASVMVGVLFARLMYRSPLRRAVFIAASFVVPLVANWFRAYLIVLIGHLTNNRLAAGVDHLIYGWVFFGLVMALMFWLGGMVREDADDVPGQAKGHVVSATSDASVLTGRVMPSASLLILTVVSTVSWPFVYDRLIAAGDHRVVDPVPIVADSGWIGTATTPGGWRPVLEGAAASGMQSFVRDGIVITVFVGYFRDQKQGSELVNTMNRLVSGKESPWEQVGRGRATALFGPTDSDVRTATIRGPARLRVWHWYSIDGRVETSDVLAKLSLAFDRLLLRTDTSGWVAVATAADTDAAGDKVLEEFVRTMGPSIQAAVAATAAR